MFNTIFFFLFWTYGVCQKLRSADYLDALTQGVHTSQAKLY